jgi:hypothetical protein
MLGLQCDYHAFQAHAQFLLPWTLVKLTSLWTE